MSRHERTLIPAKIVAIYVITGGLWILLSDLALEAAVKDPVVLSRMQTIKGWFFIAITSALLFLLIRHDMDAAERSEKTLRESEQKYRRQLLQSQKMEAVGRLASGIAHDFNNILTAIISYGSLLKMAVPEDSPERAHADHILVLADKAAQLTQSLLAFGRRQTMHPRAEDLNEIVKSSSKLIPRLIGEDIQLGITIGEEKLMIMADAGQIEQILMNLATNARDAMPEGGRLDIKTERAELDHEFVKTYGYGEPGIYALLTFVDTGMGMDESTREKIFEPFFTTKEVGKGTGLGLSIVYGIVKQHRGYINVQSRPGHGAVVKIYLPLIKAGAEEEVTEK